MIDINTAKANIETLGFLDIEIDGNIDLFAEICIRNNRYRLDRFLKNQDGVMR